MKENERKWKKKKHLTLLPRSCYCASKKILEEKFNRQLWCLTTRGSEKLPKALKKLGKARIIKVYNM